MLADLVSRNKNRIRIFCNLGTMKEKPSFKTFCLVSVLTLLFLLQGPFQAFAQQAVTSGGGTVTGSGGSLTVSIGQVVYTAHKSTAGSVIQGVQQPYEISSLGIEPADQAYSLSFQAFPNPSGGLLILKGEVPPGKKVMWQLIDAEGKVLDSGKILANETQVDMGKRPPGSYFVKLVQGNKVVRSFKIIKI